MKKAYVRIQSQININVTSGLEYRDVTNPDAHVGDRLKINSLWSKRIIPIKEGSHFYPSEITEWNTVKSLQKDKVITIGEYTDEPDFEKEEAKALKDKLNKGNQKIEVELNKDKILEKPAKKVAKKKEEFVDDIDYLEKISESEE